MNILSFFFSAAVSMTSANTEVVIATNAPKTVVFAAQEATNFLSRAFGAPVPLATAPTPGRASLVLGANEWTRAAGIDVKALPPEGFKMVTKDGAVYIAGRDQPTWDLPRLVEQGDVHLLIHPHATAFGVYEFLERYAGVRFYFPGEIGTIVPHRDEIEVPRLDEVCAPAMSVRKTCIAWDGDGSIWYEPGDDKTRRHGKALEYLRLRFESQQIPCCHGQCHARLRERFATDHPEYFALLRTWDRKDPYRDIEEKSPSHHTGQMCHTSAVWDELYEDAKAYLSGQPASVRRIPSPWRKGKYEWGRNMSGRYVDMMCQDGFQACQCARCRAAYDRNAAYGNYATELIWSNTVHLANRLKADGVRGYITQMAYPPYRNVPKGVEIPDNVRVMVAENGPWSVRNPEKCRLQYDEVAAWAKKCRGEHSVWIWTYPLKGSELNANDIPQMAPRAYHRYYKTHFPNVFGAFAENESDKWIYNYLNTYVFMKMLWNPELDLDELLDEHYALMFGPAADEMKAFYGALEDRWVGTMTRNTYESPFGPRTLPPSPHVVMTEVYSPAVLREWNGLFKKALAKCAPDSPARRRVEFIREQFLAPLVKRVHRYVEERSVERELARRKAHPEEINLIDNGDLSKTNRRGDSANWSAWPQSKSLDAKVFVSAPYSFRVTHTNRQYASCGFAKGRLKPGRLYRFSFFLKLKDVKKLGGAGSGVHMAMICGPNEVRVPSANGLDGTTDWMHYSGTFRMPKVQPKDHFPDGLLCLRLADASGTVWLDDVLVTEIPEGKKE